MPTCCRRRACGYFRKRTRHKDEKDGQLQHSHPIRCPAKVYFNAHTRFYRNHNLFFSLRPLSFSCVLSSFLSFSSSLYISPYNSISLSLYSYLYFLHLCSSHFLRASSLSHFSVFLDSSHTFIILFFSSIYFKQVSV